MTQCNFLDMFHGDNAERIPDFAALKADGILGVMHKATQGLGYVDPRYHERQAAARAAGMPWGAYAFLTGDNGTAQAAHFWAVAGLQHGERGAADYEPNPTGSTANIGTLNNFMIATDNNLATIGPKSTLLYSSNLIRETLDLKTGPFAFMVAHDLWLAEYGAERVPAPWAVAALWQWSGGGNFKDVIGKVDENFFAGTPDDFAKFWGLT